MSHNREADIPAFKGTNSGSHRIAHVPAHQNTDNPSTVVRADTFANCRADPSANNAIANLQTYSASHDLLSNIFADHIATNDPRTDDFLADDFFADDREANVSGADH